MNAKGLNIAQVKSHLQMYRIKKIDNQGQVINGRGGYLARRAEIGLRQTLVLDPKFRSDFRYRDVSWSGHGNWMSRSGTTNERCHGGVGANRRSIGGFYVDNDSTIIMQNNSNKTHEFSKHFKQWHGNGGEIRTVDFVKNSITIGTSWSSNGDQKPNRLKRKAAQDIDLELDLNLSLSMKSRQKEVKEMLWDEGVDSNLSLSLFEE